MNDYKPDICIYHGDCLDGFGAAWAIWKRWRDCDFRPGHYGKGLPLDPFEVTGKNVLFVDFSAPAAMLEAIASTAASVVVLDHHKTAKAELEPYIFDVAIGAFETGLIARRNAGLLPIVAFFREHESGAVMAWEFARGTNAWYIPEMLVLIQDRDLWRFRFEDETRQVAAALQSYPMDFDIWDQLSQDVKGMSREGAALLRANRANVAKILKEAYFDEIAGWTVPVVNAPWRTAAGKRPQTCGKAAAVLFDITGMIAWLRERFPRATIHCVEAETGIPAATVENWLHRRSQPSVEHFTILISTFGPSLLKACLSKPQIWIDTAAALERRREIDAQIASLKREQLSLLPDQGEAA